MEFTIVGAGQVGRSLESALTTLGHQVRLARRAPEADNEVALAGSAQGCDAVILATPFVATGEIVPQLGIGQGQLVIDATNPFGRAWPAGFSTADFSSGGEFVQSLIPQAHVVKCFNVIGYEHMDRPQFAGVAPFMPVCGNDAEAKEGVLALAATMGFDAHDIGDLSKAALVENMGLLWGALRDVQGARNFAFGLLRGQN